MLKNLVVLVLVVCLTGDLTQGKHLRKEEPLGKKAECDFRKEVHNKLTFTLYIPGGATETADNLYDLIDYIYSAPTLLFINNGFNEEYLHNFEKQFSRSLDKEGQNLIFAKWMSSNEEPYLAGAVEIGEKLAISLKRFVTDIGLNFYPISFVGHGYGAVIAGRAANLINEADLEYDLLVNKIVALDPPSELDELPPYQKLSKTSAYYVSVVHTSIGDGGIEEPIGHRDYYPNGGRKQPHCDHNLSCNRDAAYKFYTQAAKKKSDKFDFTECSDYKKYESARCENNEISNLFYDSYSNAPEGKYFADIDLREKPNFK